MRFLAVSLLAASAVSQGVPAVASFDVRWDNATGSGSSVLQTRVHAPLAGETVGTASAANTTIVPPAGGWPTIVFLHGFGLPGRAYDHICSDLARQGFLVLAPDTALCDPTLLAADALANVAAAIVASGQSGDPLFGAIDATRVAIAGHSMGAACMPLALTSNTVFRCAYAFAPASPFGLVPAVLDVPVGIAVGAGDAVTTFQQQALPYFDHAQPTWGMKMIHCFDASSTHMSLVGLAGQTADYERALDICAGFLQHFLDVDASAIERCIGPDVLADPLVVAQEQAVVQPRIWPATQPRIGQISRVSVAAAPGDSAILVSDALTSGVPTALGTLLLDPATTFTWVVGFTQRERRLDVLLAVPNSANLIGLPVAMQPLAPTANAGASFGAAIAFTVAP